MPITSNVQGSSEASETLPATEGGDASVGFSQTIADSYDKLMQGELTEASSTLLVSVVFPAFCALAMIIVAYFAAKLIARWTSVAICNRVDQTLGKFAGKLAFYAVMLVSSIAVLQTMGFGVTSFAAVLAAAGFAIGLAFQGTLSNFAAGVLLLVFRPFQVGDVVNTAGITGKVNAIDLFTTTFDTPDNRRLIVPNSAITGATIENTTFHSERRVDVAVGVDYAASLDQTRAVLTSCAECFEEVTIQDEGRGYQVILTNLSASSVDWVIRLWTRKEDYFAVKEALTEEIKLQLDEQGIGIPFPQMEVHFPKDVPNTEPVESQEDAEEEEKSPISNVEPFEIPSIPTVEVGAPRTAQRPVRPRIRSGRG
ncbi:MAG: mechanosensitive ion channel domain-containing protein [Planctomycetota bacterium]